MKMIYKNQVVWVGCILCILIGLTLSIYRFVYITQNKYIIKKEQDKSKWVTIGSILTIVGVIVLALTQKHHLFTINEESGFIKRALSTPNILAFIAGLSLLSHILLSNNLFSAAEIYNKESIFGPNMPVLIFYSLYCFIFAFILIRFPTAQNQSTLSKILSILNNNQESSNIINI